MEEPEDLGLPDDVEQVEPYPLENVVLPVNQEVPAAEAVRAVDIPLPAYQHESPPQVPHEGPEEGSLENPVKFTRMNVVSRDGNSEVYRTAIPIFSSEMGAYVVASTGTNVQTFKVKQLQGLRYTQEKYDQWITCFVKKRNRQIRKPFWGFKLAAKFVLLKITCSAAVSDLFYVENMTDFATGKPATRNTGHFWWIGALVERPTMAGGVIVPIVPPVVRNQIVDRVVKRNGFDKWGIFHLWDYFRLRLIGVTLNTLRHLYPEKLRHGAGIQAHSQPCVIPMPFTEWHVEKTRYGLFLMEAFSRFILFSREYPPSEAFKDQLKEITDKLYGDGKMEIKKCSLHGSRDSVVDTVAKLMGDIRVGILPGSTVLKSTLDYLERLKTDDGEFYILVEEKNTRKHAVTGTSPDAMFETLLGHPEKHQEFYDSVVSQTEKWWYMKHLNHKIRVGDIVTYTDRRRRNGAVSSSGDHIVLRVLYDEQTDITGYLLRPRNGKQIVTVNTADNIVTKWNPIRGVGRIASGFHRRPQEAEAAAAAPEEAPPPPPPPPPDEHHSPPAPREHQPPEDQQPPPNDDIPEGIEEVPSPVFVPAVAPVPSSSVAPSAHHSPSPPSVHSSPSPPPPPREPEPELPQPAPVPGRSYHGRRRGEEEPVSDEKVIVKKSSIPDAGNGLFAWDPDSKIVFRKGDRITYYAGKIVKRRGLAAAADEYVLRVHEGMFIDGDPKWGMATAGQRGCYINSFRTKDKDSKSKSNCRFASVPNPDTHFIAIIATRTIHHGEEILISYGSGRKEPLGYTHE